MMKWVLSSEGNQLFLVVSDVFSRTQQQPARTEHTSRFLQH
jgi:hypothetical protein